MVSGKSPASGYIALSQTAWKNLHKVLVTLNALLPREDRSGFITLSDLHVGVWFARILVCVGAKELADVSGAFAKLGMETGAKDSELGWIQRWWASMITRKR